MIAPSPSSAFVAAVIAVIFASGLVLAATAGMIAAAARPELPGERWDRESLILAVVSAVGAALFLVLVSSPFALAAAGLPLAAAGYLHGRMEGGDVRLFIGEREVQPLWRRSSDPEETDGYGDSPAAEWDGQDPAHEPWRRSLDRWEDDQDADEPPTLI